MKWFRIDKENSSPASESHYSGYKENLAKEGRHQCVYCSISERAFGGIRNFHVEHYRPKSRFPELELEYNNLFYACSICNTFKGNDWFEHKSNSEFNTVFYPDPSKIDYSEILSLDSSFLAESDYTVGLYLIQKLYLNRYQLIMERRRSFLVNSIKQEITEIKGILEGFKNSEEENILVKLTKNLIKAFEAFIIEAESLPYSLSDIKK